MRHASSIVLIKNNQLSLELEYALILLYIVKMYLNQDAKISLMKIKFQTNS